MNKKLLVTLLIAITLLAGIGSGVYMAKQKEEKAEAAEKAFWEKQKPRIELYFRYNYEGIKSFTYTGTEESPMGISIDGYVNDNPKHDFSAFVSGYESEFNYTVSYSEEFSEAYEVGKESKNVNEILEEQKESH